MEAGAAEVTRQAGLRSSGEVVARLERLPISPWHMKARAIVGVATFFDAYNALAIAYVLPVLVPLFHLTGPEIGAMISTGYLGQLVGALVFGWMAERYGRRPAILWSILLYAVFSVATAFAHSYGQLLVLRTIQGIGLGGEVPVAIAYISELATAKNRGRFVLLFEMVFPVGLLASALLGLWVVPHLGWQVMLAIGGLPAFAALGMYRIIPESPRWLAQHGRFAEAEAALSFIEQEVVRGTGRTLAAPQKWVEVEEKRGSLQDLFGPVYLRRTLVVWVAWFATYLVNYGLITWLPTLYRNTFHLPLQQALEFSLITSVCGLFASFFCALYMDHVGRRLWATLAFGIGAVPLLALGILGADTPIRLLVLATLGSAVTNTMSLGLYVWTPELYPTRVRAIAVGTSTAWLRLASIIGPTFVGAMVGSGGLDVVFIAFGIVGLIAAVVMALFGVETRRQVLETISP
jgi:MFS transporter, putative metabolite:H+ symporter